ncbi:MAG: hypothetical protein GW773_01795 [Candidatus Pacebacteria bacterium]|nr:hypothetical protein [Candidatus Paceibacterota bacterium]
MQSIIHKIKKFKFKKVYYFDLFVVLVIFSIISIFLYNRFTKKSLWIDAQIQVSDGELWWRGDDPPFWFLNDLKSGMIARNSFGEEIAKITDVEIYSNEGIYKQANVKLKLKVSFDKTRDTYLYNFQPIQKGKPIDLAFGSNNVSGLVVSLGSQSEERFEKRIKVKMQYLDDWLAEAYQVGMEMKDSKGRSLARIDSVSLDESKLDNSIMFEGNLSLLNNQSKKGKWEGKLYQRQGQLKDAILEISLSTFKEEDFYRFVDGTPIKIGNEINFYFSEISAKAKIMEIIE